MVYRLIMSEPTEGKRNGQAILKAIDPEHIVSILPVVLSYRLCKTGLSWAKLVSGSV